MRPTCALQTPLMNFPPCAVSELCLNISQFSYANIPYSIQSIDVQVADAYVNAGMHFPIDVQVVGAQ